MLANSRIIQLRNKKKALANGPNCKLHSCTVYIYDRVLVSVQHDNALTPIMRLPLSYAMNHILVAILIVLILY